jgi:hypothetical protein
LKNIVSSAARLLSRLTAVLLCLSILTPAAAGAADIETALGDVYYSYDKTLASGLDYAELYSAPKGLDSSQELRSFVLTYDPASSDVTPSVTWGSYVYGRETVASMISDDAAYDGTYVAAAVNADFFSMETGAPLGLIVRDGQLISNSETSSALVITPSGAEIVQPKIAIQIQDGGGSAAVTYFNKYPSVYGAYLLTSDWGKTTHSTAPSREIALEKVDGSFGLNSHRLGEGDLDKRRRDELADRGGNADADDAGQQRDVRRSGLRRHLRGRRDPLRRFKRGHTHGRAPRGRRRRRFAQRRGLRSLA